MLGGLYGDLPPPSSNPSDDDKPPAAVWSSATKMAPPTLRKPSTAFAPPPSVLRNQHLRPTPKATPAAAVAVAVTAPAPPLPVETTTSAPFQPALVAVQSTVLEEYDPARPNDYEDYRRDKLKRVKEAEMKKELERRRREEEEREREREQRERESREREERDFQSRASSLNISGEEAWRRRAAMSGPAQKVAPSSPPHGDGFTIGSSSSSGLGLGAGGQMTAAQRMMAKMGWKEGQGLGKQEQGITAPLVAKKTDRRGGVIVDENNSKPEKKTKSVNIDDPPTRVLLLRNMVGPGEVDDDLEDEVASECAKYGTVSRVLIFEITQANFPADEAVRIFIQFSRAEEATKAMIDLEGRFFGGRVVRASFFDEDRFGRNELAPMPGEVAGFD